VQSYSKEDVLARLKVLYPKATPAWLQAFGKWLMDNAPAILAAIMALIPKAPAAGLSPQHAMALATFAATFEACDPSAPRPMKGPMFDGQIHAGVEAAKDLLQKAEVSAVEYAQSVIEHYLSGITP
jgi:hypothetical protein